MSLAGEEPVNLGRVTPRTQQNVTIALLPDVTEVGTARTVVDVQVATIGAVHPAVVDVQLCHA